MTASIRDLLRNESTFETFRIATTTGARWRSRKFRDAIESSPALGSLMDDAVATSRCAACLSELDAEVTSVAAGRPPSLQTTGLLRKLMLGDAAKTMDGTAAAVFLWASCIDACADLSPRTQLGDPFWPVLIEPSIAGLADSRPSPAPATLSPLVLPALPLSFAGMGMAGPIGAVAVTRGVNDAVLRLSDWLFDDRRLLAAQVLQTLYWLRIAGAWYLTWRAVVRLAEYEALRENAGKPPDGAALAEAKGGNGGSS